MIEAAERLGTLTTLVDNAGVSSTVRGDMLDLPVESLDRTIRINLRAPFLLNRTFARHLIKKRTASDHFCTIVNKDSAVKPSFFARSAVNDPRFLARR
jgi:NAD(P)-dependent dehydrogenase (short-subunit alcohol dehydrogenase family)